ncbi:lipooligosaccharide biosynthesis protein LpsA, partial [Haemophilus paraphrohaemolyticus]
RKFYKLTKSNSGTGGYIVTKKGIDFLVKNIKEIKYIEIDNLLFKQLLLKKEYTVWQMQPAVCIQDCLLNPQTSSFGVMGGEGGERDQRRDKKNKKKLPLIIRLVKEVKRPFVKLNKKFLGKKAYFK